MESLLSDETYFDFLKALRTLGSMRSCATFHEYKDLQRCRMGHFFGRFDRSTPETPKKPAALADATPNPPNTLDRIYSSYQSEMPRENIGETSAKTFAE